MNDNTSSILILGTKGVGKTTLLTVLGTKFERMGAFGLSMVPCDRATQLFVRNAAHGMAVNHSFPGATDRSDVKPLSWDVLAGTEHLFRVFSLDCAGETISQVFGGNEPVDDGIDEGQEMRRARETLSDLANGAAAVCLVLAPHQLPGNRSATDLADPATATRMYEIDDLIHAAAHSPRFEGKRFVIVLTRTDGFEVRDEIARFGGPRGYLRAKCPPFANSKRFDDAHVVAVSPVVTNDCDGLQGHYVPENFESLGLEDVLIGLGGAVNSPLSPLADAYRELRRSEWHDAQTLRSGGAADRLSAARRRSAAAESFEAAANDFFDASCADASIRKETELRIRESVVEAQVRLAEEEAVAYILTKSRTPSDPSQLRDKLVSEALAAAKSVPGAPPVVDEDLFLSSPDWAERERLAFPRLRREREEALFTAIKAKDRIGAEKAYRDLIGMGSKERLPKYRKQRIRIDKIEYPDQVPPLLCMCKGKMPNGQAFTPGAGRLVCRNGVLGFQPGFWAPYSPEVNPVMRTPLGFVPAILISITFPISLPILWSVYLYVRKIASRWHCPLSEIQTTSIDKKWFTCHLKIVTRDGGEVEFSKPKNCEADIAAFLSGIKKLD